MANKQTKSQFSGTFYKLLFDNANDGILMANLETRKFHSANQTVCKMLGYSHKEIMDLGVADIHPKKDLSYVIREFERLSKGNIGENILTKELPVKRKNGSIFYADVSASRAKLGRRMYLMGIFRDTTNQKRIEKDLENTNIAARNVAEDLQVEKEMLAHANAKDEALLDSIGDGVVATNKEGRIILMNRMAEQMFGLSAKESLGKLLTEMWQVFDEKGNLIPMEKRPIAIALSGRATTTTTTTTTGLSYYYSKKNGTKFPVAITVTPVEVDNKIIGAIDVFRDITREKEIEKLRTDFLSLASHQLRTPLSGTKWLIETMNRGILGKVTIKQKKYLEQIYELNERMIELVSEMMNVLNLESSVESIKNETVSIANIYKDLPPLMTAAAKSKQIILHNNLKNHKTITVITDSGILKNILECFIANAINYSNKKQNVTLDVLNKTSSVVFFVKDNGIGIPEKENKQIFNKFYRASNAKAFKPGGSGLGLNIAMTLAKKIGAKIWFESQENKGSIFYLSIPKNNGTIIR